MKKYSLEFKDQLLESKFQSSIHQKLSIQCKLISILIIIEESLVTINSLLKEQYIASIFLISFLIAYLVLYGVIVKYPRRIKYGIRWFNYLSFFLPIALQIYIWFIDVELVDKVSVTIGIMNVIPQFVLSQDIFIFSGLYIYTMVMIVISCTQLIGFSWFLCIPPIFSISWISSKFQNIKLERTFFSESQTNECLATVLRRICKEKIMIFTYDDTNIKYQEYLLNDECNKYFQDCPINEILSNIFVTQYEIQVSMSSYIHRNIIQNHNEDEFYSEAFQGYFKEKKNKINIELYVQTTSKTFFTIKITEIQKENCFSKTKAKQLLQIQNKVLHKILPKFIEIFHQNISQTTKIQQFYQYLNQKIQILQLFVICNSKNIQFLIIQFNLAQQIRLSFNRANINFVQQFIKHIEIDSEGQQLDNMKETLIYSDQFLISILLDNILMLIRVTIAKNSIVKIQGIYKGEYLYMNFSYQSLNQPIIREKNYQGLLKSLAKLVQILGIEKSLVIKKSLIKLTLLNSLEQGYL